jgi:hypothetical protein
MMKIALAILGLLAFVAGAIFSFLAFAASAQMGGLGPDRPIGPKLIVMAFVLITMFQAALVFFGKLFWPQKSNVVASTAVMGLAMLYIVLEYWLMVG